MTQYLIIILLLSILLITYFNKKRISKYYGLYRDGKSPLLVVVFLLLFGLLLLLIPFMLTTLSWMPLSYENTGEVGDIIGGSTAPFIGFVAIIVTFFAFWVQYQANIQQVASNTKQSEDISKERFENQYYEMLRLHKDNVQEMNIANSVTGRKCFVRMFYEFRYIYLQLFSISKAHAKLLGKNYDKGVLCDLAYKMFFNGIGSKNDDTILMLFSKGDHPLIALVRDLLHNIQNDWLKANQTEVNYDIPAVQTEDNNNYVEFECIYYPFDGHTTRLSHYYRHLFQTVSFVADTELDYDRNKRYKYLKLLRAQLSDHEQLLLYYNGLVSFGSGWVDNGYFSDYRMVKNVPFIYANFGIKPSDKFPALNRFGEPIFEWRS